MLWGRTAGRPSARDTSGWDWHFLSTPIRLVADEAAVRESLGVPTHPRGSPGGPDGFDAWLLEHPCGLALVVAHRAGDEWQVSPDDADLDHVLHHLALPARAIWRADHDMPQMDLGAEPWLLWRYDDNGNQVEVRRFASRLAAECSMRTFEARGHHQTYVIERAG